MEKTTKKKKKSKGLKKRIGIIAVGGLSLVLTICLSVGATLAWFAGSTWSSNQMYMGGPVYVEMSGVGTAGNTNGSGTDAVWKGGSGNLHIQAATQRTGTVGEAPNGVNANNILLPGQKFEIYSQARVFSTTTTSNVGTDDTYSQTTGGNVTNTSSNGTVHKLSKGRVTTTTSSVLRARFSVSVEFDPTSGFNNFTDESYSDNYPVQSTAYNGHYMASGSTATSDVLSGGSLSWASALGKPSFKNQNMNLSGPSGSTPTYAATARRDAVKTGDYVAGIDSATLAQVRSGDKKSIYAWKFVSADVYDDAEDTPADVGATVNGAFAKMGYPFDGTDTTYGANGYYGVWIIKNNHLSESDAFYKDRCNSYIDSYVEEYVTEYGEIKKRTIGESLKALETSLNQAFVTLVNDSSDNIAAGKVFGMTVNNGIMTYANSASGMTWAAGNTNASWLYIDPVIGNDTNTNELSTSAGGWWYLVEGNGASVDGTGDGANKVYVTDDSVSGSGATATNNPTKTPATSGVTLTSAFVSGDTITAGKYFVRNTPAATSGGSATFTSTDPNRLYAKLYEINPLMGVDETLGTGTARKIVSYSFPFVNGTSALPGDALTNVFANAKITIQISFQALQAFLPYSSTIDGMSYTDALLGTAKALNIKNAIPIFNEAFDYQESFSNDTITGL